MYFFFFNYRVYGCLHHVSAVSGGPKSFSSLELEVVECRRVGA